MCVVCEDELVRKKTEKNGKYEKSTKQSYIKSVKASSWNRQIMCDLTERICGMTILSVNTLRINKVLAYVQRIRGFARAT